jgi:hypothetical protein
MSKAGYLYSISEKLLYSVGLVGQIRESPAFIKLTQI